LVAAHALGCPLGVDTCNPVVAVVAPEPGLVSRYAELRAVSDAAVAATLPLTEVAG